MKASVSAEALRLFATDEQRPCRMALLSCLLLGGSGTGGVARSVRSRVLLPTRAILSPTLGGSPHPDTGR
jgi:hypothetical protein